MSVNAHRPRRIKSRDQLLVGMWFERRSDHSVWQLRNIYRSEKKVQLAPDFGGRPMTIPRSELQRDYEQVAL